MLPLVIVPFFNPHESPFSEKISKYHIFKILLFTIVFSLQLTIKVSQLAQLKLKSPTINKSCRHFVLIYLLQISKQFIQGLLDFVTYTGKLFKIKSIPTVSGALIILKYSAVTSVKSKNATYLSYMLLILYFFNISI